MRSTPGEHIEDHDTGMAETSVSETKVCGTPQMLVSKTRGKNQGLTSYSWTVSVFDRLHSHK